MDIYRTVSGPSMFLQTSVLKDVYCYSPKDDQSEMTQSFPGNTSLHSLASQLQSAALHILGLGVRSGNISIQHMHRFQIFFK